MPLTFDYKLLIRPHVPIIEKEEEADNDEEEETASEEKEVNSEDWSILAWVVVGCYWLHVFLVCCFDQVFCPCISAWNIIYFVGFIIAL